MTAFIAGPYHCIERNSQSGTGSGCYGHLRLLLKQKRRRKLSSSRSGHNLDVEFTKSHPNVSAGNADAMVILNSVLGKALTVQVKTIPLKKGDQLPMENTPPAFFRTNRTEVQKYSGADMSVGDDKTGKTISIWGLPDHRNEKMKIVFLLENIKDVPLPLVR